MEKEWSGIFGSVYGLLELFRINYITQYNKHKSLLLKLYKLVYSVSLYL